MKIFIYYLGVDHVAGLDFESPTCLGKTGDRKIDGIANMAKAIIAHPNAEKYSLEDFCLAFNDEYISDQGFIAYKEEEA